MTSSDYSEFDTELKAFQFTKKDGLLASGYYKHWKNEIEAITKTTNKSKYNLSKISPLEHKKFEANMKVWLENHPVEKFDNPSDRKEAFEKYVKTEYDKVLEIAISDEVSVTDGEITTSSDDGTPIIEDGKQKKIKANKEDLTGKKEEPKVKKQNVNSRGGAKPENRATDPELEIDLAKLTIIPNGLSRGERAKFLRENENTISQDEYDRIFKKQNDLQLAKGN